MARELGRLAGWWGERYPDGVAVGRGIMSPSLQIHTVVSMPFEQNSFVVHAPGRSDALVIDPGLEPEAIVDVLHEHGLTLAAILNTHGHADHIGGNAALKREYPEAPIIIGAAAVTPNFSSRAFFNSTASSRVSFSIFSTISWIADMGSSPWVTCFPFWWWRPQAAFFFPTSSMTLTSSRSTAATVPGMPAIGASRLPSMAAMSSDRVGIFAISSSREPSYT